MPLFAFSQIEVPWPLGPPDGRYLVRAPGAEAGSQPTHVLLFSTLGAPQRGRWTRRRQTAAPEPPPTPVATGRATVIACSDPFADAEAAARWLAASGEPELAAHLRLLERALHAFRVVTADPFGEASPLARDRLLVARIGYGEGDEVADGRWSAARELLPAPGPRRRRRRLLLEPQARLAGVLGGHVPLLVCEELALRARRDLEAGRPRQAALQLRIAVEACFGELADHGGVPAGGDGALTGGDAAPAGGGGAPAGGDGALAGGAGLATRLAELGELRLPADLAAHAALGRELDAGELVAVAAALDRLEALLRARAASLA